MGKTRSLVTAAFLAAVLVASKFALDGLPNIELVSLLVILYTLEYPRLAVPAVYTYVFVYGLLNGFGIWWFPQLYIWAVLMLFARLMRQNRSVLLWALLSGLFGLCYGALYAVSYAVMNGGIAAGVAWWVTGIPFDLLHGAGNLVMLLPDNFRREDTRGRVQRVNGRVNALLGNLTAQNSRCVQVGERLRRGGVS